LQRLWKKKANVTIIDNFSSGKKDNLKGFNGKIIDANIIDADKKKVLNDSTKFDVIFHEASITDTTFPDDSEMIRQNVEGFKTALRIAQANNAKLVYVSSAAVYGNVNVPMKEDGPIQALNAYAKSKLEIDKIAKQYHDKMHIVGLRYFNVFGPRQNPKSKYSAVIPLFITALLKNEKPSIHSDGNQSRDFTFVKNIAKANILALKSDSKQGETINIACGDSISVNDIFNKIKDYLEKDIQPDYHPERKGDVRHSLADIKKAKELIGYEPYVSFDEGLKQTIDWYKEDYKE